MKRKPLILLALLLVVGIAMLGVLWKEMIRPEIEENTTASEAEGLTYQSISTDDSEVIRPESDPCRRNPDLPPSLLDDLNSMETVPQNDVRLLGMLFADYASVFKRMPLGIHQEIVAALNGDNPRSIAYIPEGHPAVSVDNEIIDRWGKPFFFHVISKSAVEIISAGPEGAFFTDDDIRDAPPNAAVEPVSLSSVLVID
ncbi:MAG: hypothetical protein ACI9DF_000839 [Verrucomicrobiales bacterium]|jgi:hypothetical protein